MKKIILLLLCILHCVFCFNIMAINVIPYPYEYDVNPLYRYYFNEQSAIVCKHKSLMPVAELFSQQIAKSTGINLPILKRSKNANLQPWVCVVRQKDTLAVLQCIERHASSRVQRGDVICAGVITVSYLSAACSPALILERICLYGSLTDACIGDGESADV